MLGKEHSVKKLPRLVQLPSSLLNLLADVALWAVVRNTFMKVPLNFEQSNVSFYSSLRKFLQNDKNIEV